MFVARKNRLRQTSIVTLILFIFSMLFGFAIPGLAVAATQVPTWDAEAKLTVNDLSGSGFNLGWPAASEAENYKVTVSNTTGGITTPVLDNSVTEAVYCPVSGLTASRRYDIEVNAANSIGDSPTSLKTMVVTPPSGSVLPELVPLPLNNSGARYKFQPDATKDNGKSNNYETVFNYDDVVKPAIANFEWYLQGGFNNSLSNIKDDIKAFRLFNLTDGTEVTLNYGTDADFAGVNANPNRWPKPTTVTTGDFIITRLMAYSVHLVIKPDIAKYLEPDKEYAITIDPQFNTGGQYPVVLGNIYRFEFSTSPPDTEDPKWGDGAQISVGEITADSITLSWPEASDDTIVAKYKIAYSKSDNIVSNLETADNSTSYTVSGLSSNTEYSFSVTALDAGRNESSALTAVKAKTLPAVPVWSENAALTAESIMATELILRWPQVSNPNDLAGYKVYVDGVEEASLPAIQNYYELGGLNSGIKYILAVKPFNEVGQIGEALETMVVTPGAGGLTFTFAPYAIDKGETGFYHNYEIVNPVDMDNFSLAWNFGNGLDKNLRFNLECIHLIEKSSGQEVTLDLGSEPYVSTLEGVFEAGDFKYISTGGGEGTGGGAGGGASATTKTRMLKFEPGAATLAQITKGAQYVIEIDPEFTANNGTAKLGKIFSFTFNAGVDDEEAPAWPANAKITASKVGTDAFVLSWPKAEDNVGIIEYQLFKQGESLELINTFNCDTISYKMEDLSPDTTYNLVLRARDAKSQYTPDLTLSITTLLSDDQAPDWAAGSRLMADNVLTDTMDLSWTAASDNVEVTGYRLLKNGSMVTDFDANTFSYHIIQLTPGTSCIFKVEARDKAGNYSSTGPKLAISTLEGEVDTTAPYWTNTQGYSTSLTVTYDKSYVTYQWPWAADNVAVTGYLVYRDGVQIATVNAYTNKYSDILDVDDKHYSYSVYAVDASGNMSEAGKSMSVYSGNPDQDVYSPVWPADTSITLSEFTDTTMKVQWTPAEDNVGVTNYVVIKDGLWITSTNGDDCDLLYDHTKIAGAPALVSGETYIFSVKAFDNPQNSSKGDPKITMVMGTNPTAGAGIPFSLTNVDNSRGSLNSVTGALNQVLAPQDPENIKFTWEFEEPLAAGYQSKISLSNIDTGEMIALDPADILYSENEGKGLLTLDLAQTGIKLLDTTQYAVKLDKTLAAQGGKQLGFDIAWNFSTDVADKEAPYWGAEDVLNVGFDKAPTIATLSWPSAVDNVAVTGYQVYRGDEMLAVLSPEASSYDVEGLAVNTPYTFKIVAGDYLDNFSNPLTAAPTTPAADTAVPEWQDSDVLTFNNITSDNLTVSWPAAADNYQIETYKVYLDSDAEPVAEVAGNVLSYIITGLAGETAYNVIVRAFDYTGNTVDLTGNVTTIADQVSPLWLEGSTLQARDIKDTSVTLYWDAASDNVGVTRYNIYCNGDKVQSVDGATCEATVSDLKGSTEYTFEVEAEDLKENKSADKLSLIQWTAPGSITAGAAFPFNLDQPLSHNVNYDVESNTLNNAVDGSFTKNSVAFTFSFTKTLVDNTWLSNIELKDNAGTVIPLDASAFTYVETAGSSSKLKIAVPASLVSNGEYVLTVKGALKAADETLLGRSFTWNFNVSVGPYGVTDIAAGYNSYSPFLPATSRYYLMLKDDGSVWTWGNNDYGTLGDGTTDSRDIPTRVEILSNIVALEAGRDSCFALDRDGAVWAWGSNEYGQLGRGTEPGGTSGRYGNNTPEKIEGLPAIEKLHYGFGNVAALDENGEVWIWGNAAQAGLASESQRSGTPAKVSGLTDIIDVAAGFKVFMAVSSDGDVYSFGSGNAPSKVAGLSEIVAVNAEGIDQRHTVRMALKADGTAYIWDANNIEPVTSTPTRVEDATQVKAVIADGPYVLGTDGQVTCVAYSTAPVLGAQISGLNNVVKLASSAKGGLALQTDGTLLQFIGTEVSEVPLNLDTADVPVWPEGSAIEITNQAETGLTLNWEKPNPNVSTFAVYQDGNLITTISGNTLRYNVLGLTKGQTYTFKLQARFVNSNWSVNGPETSTTMTDWNPAMQGAGKLAMSAGHTLMIGNDGSVWAWGQNDYGQLGLGDNTERLTPVKIESISNITAVAVGDNHSLALDQDGNVWAWGRNHIYQLGDGSTTDSNVPLKIINSGDIKAIAAAADHNIALKNDGTVLGWGVEDTGPPSYYLLSGIDGHTPGQLKGGTTSPAYNYLLTGVKGISTGRGFNTFLFDDGRICYTGKWGTGMSPMRNYFGFMGIKAISAGEGFILGLKEDGTVVAVGDNSVGQFGNGTQGSSSSNVVLGLNNIIAIAAGGYHGMALDQNGDVYTWGKNLYGQLGNGKNDVQLIPIKVAGLSEITAIEGGAESSIAFRNMQKVYVYGKNDNGQLGNDSKTNAKVPTVAKMAGYDQDVDAPVWPAYFALVATDINENGTTLIWTPAKDDIAVTAYEIYVNGNKKAEVNGMTQEYVLDDLTANTSYTFGIKARDAIGNTGVMSKTISATMEDSLTKVSPILTADISNNIPGQPIDITFGDDGTWRDAIVGITVDGTLIETSGYEISAGKITIEGIVFNEAKNYAIIVKATGYADASITQTINSAPAPITAPKLQLAEITNKGDLSLTFDKEIANPAGIQGQFTVIVDGAAVTVSTVEKTNTAGKIKLVLNTKATGAYNVTINYTKSSDPAKQLKSADGGIAESFSTQIGEALATPPALKKDTSNNRVGNSIDITFVDDAAWRNAISDVTIDGTSISGKYTISAGKITIDAGLFTQARNYAIAVKATGYNDASVTQKMHKVITEANVTVNENHKNLAVSSTTPAATVTIPDGVSDATINVGDLLNTPAGGVVETAALPALTVAADTSIHDNPVQVEIPGGTTVSAPEGWDGTINVPTVQANDSVTVTPGAGKKATVKAVIEVGFGDVPLTFSKAIKLVIPGQAGKDAGYSRNGTFTPITKICDENSQAWADANIPAGGDGKVDDGQDLVIWTKHFTLFATYEQSPTGGSGDETPEDLLTVSFTKANLSPTDTLLQFDFGNGMDRTLSSNLSKIRVYEKNTGNEVQYSNYNYIKKGQGDDAVKIRRLELSFNNLNSGTTYVVELAADVEANNGSTLGTQKSFEFTTTGTASGGAAPAVEQGIGTNGGTINEYGTKIEIPAASFGQNIKVTVQKIADVSKLPMAAKSKLASDVVEIIKDKDGNFNKAVTITITFDKSKADTNKYDLSICYLNEQENKWIALDNVKVDLAAAEVSGETKHFTKFAVIATEKAEATLPVGSGKLINLSDIQGHWAQQTIAELIALGAIGGYPDGTFKPDQGISRAEFASILVKALKLEQKQGKVFEDTAGHWAKDAIATAAAYGIVNGYSDTSFGPDDSITREQMAVMIVKAAKLAETKEGKAFADGNKVSSWASNAVATASQNKIINGYSDNSFRPQNNASRAEAATVIINALKLAA